MEVSYEGPHEARFADARGQREAERREVALVEGGDGGVVAMDQLPRGLGVRAFLKRQHFGDIGQDFERIALRLAQAETVGDDVDVPVHAGSPSVNRSACPAVFGFLAPAPFLDVGEGEGSLSESVASAGGRLDIDRL